MVARLSLLELVVDRMVLLAETTCGHNDQTPAIDCAHCHVEPSALGEAGDGADAVKSTEIEAGGGVSALGRLCKQVAGLRGQIERLQLLLDNKDAQLEKRDAMLAATDPPTKPITDVVSATTQTLCEAGTTPQCDGCARMLAATASVNDEINGLGLVDRDAVGPAGLSPFQCTKLCEKYLLSSAKRLRALAAMKAGWLRERDEALAGKRAAEEEAAIQTARATAAETKLADARATNRTSLDAAELTLTEEVARWEEELATATAALTQAAQATARATATDHSEQLQHAREEAAAHVTKLTKDLLEANELNAAATSALKSARHEAASVADELTVARTAAAAAATERDRLRKQVATLADQLEAVSGEAEKTRRESATMREAAQLQESSTAVRATQRIAELEKHHVTLEASAADASARASTAEQRAAVAEAARVALNKEVDEMVGKVEECRVITEEAVKARADAEAWLDKAGAERRRLLQKLAKFSNSATSTRSDVSSTTPSRRSIASVDSRRSSDFEPRMSQQKERVASDPCVRGEEGAAATTAADAAATVVRSSAPHRPTGPPIAIARARRETTPNVARRQSPPTLRDTPAQSSLHATAKSDRQAAIRKYLAARTNTSSR